jgi:tripartite-type tricarboxylate transporter receptor subunit TctC
MAKRHVLSAILIASIAIIPSASAEEFPNRPITWVVPFAPGGITDTTSRIVAEEMARTLGQSVVIDNRAGGGGAVGTEQVARARPDGYTMIYGTQGTMAANVTLRKKPVLRSADEFLAGAPGRRKPEPVRGLSRRAL